MEVSQFPVRLNPVTIREVGIVQVTTFHARAGLNPGTIRAIKKVRSNTFCAREIGLSPLALVCGGFTVSGQIESGNNSRNQKSEK